MYIHIYNSEFKHFSWFKLMLYSMSITLPFLIASYNTTKFLSTFYCQCLFGPLLCDLKMIKTSIMPVWGMWEKSSIMEFLSCCTVSVLASPNCPLQDKACQL